MRSASRHILFLATEYDAPGMRPYARAIINAMWRPGDQVLVVTRYGADQQAFPEIPADNILWIDYPTSAGEKALFRLFPKRVMRAIEGMIDCETVNLVFSLTEELILSGRINRLQRRVPVLYTVHDATFHDYKAANLVRWLKDRILIARPQRQLLRNTTSQVTNSHEQLDAIKQHYPYHKVYYAPFPTLVNEAIAHGDKPVEELRTVDDGYILFFGTLHLYKGVHLLYDAYLSHPELHNRRLVIAGSQDIYFNARPDEKNVVWINRYIDDSELRDLFMRASVVVYPYVSATQSGVTSIASYFGKPMVLSDLPFFTQTCGGCEGIEFFTSGDRESLAAAIGRSLLNTAVDTRPLYEREYAQEALRTALEDIIADFD